MVDLFIVSVLIPNQEFLFQLYLGIEQMYQAHNWISWW